MIEYMMLQIVMMGQIGQKISYNLLQQFNSHVRHQFTNKRVDKN